MSSAHGAAGRAHTEVSGGVATITLANVAARNSLDIPFAAEIRAHVEEAAGRADVGVILVRADGTGWMALYCLSMLEIAIVLAEQDPAYEDVAVKFFEHFTMISEAINDRGL
jgi:enoyl-CoA hydratase/carnithine racemase